MGQEMNFDTKTFRNVLGLFVTGVTIITTRTRDGDLVGVTANSFNSVSLDPPLVLWSIGNNSRSLKAFDEASHFAVHILRDDQQDLSNRFARSATDKFDGLELETGAEGIPLLNDYAARFECSAYSQHPAGDHVVIIARVERFEFDGGARPLVYHGGRYAELSDKPAEGA